VGPEATLWDWLKRGLRPLGLPHDVHRIETSTETGYPDVEGCICGGCFLVELKVAHYVRKDSSFALGHYTSKQAYALYKRWKAGGRSWLLIRVEVLGGVRHYLVPGREALIVHDERLRLTVGFLEAVSWPSFEDGMAKADRLWRAISGPIRATDDASDR
jgi:hypothetical protein